MTCGLSLSSSPAQASLADATRKAAHLLRQGNDKEALKIYEDALQEQPNDPLLNFNAAAAYYKTRRFDRARELYQKLLSSGNRRIEEASAYNIGNTYLQESESAADKAGEFLQKASTYYRQAMSLDSKDRDAKYNYELTQKRIEQKKASGSSPTERASSSKSSPPDQKEKNKDRESGAQKENSADQEQNQSQEQKSQSQTPTENQPQSQTPQPGDHKDNEGLSAAEPRQSSESLTKDEAKALLQDYGRDQLRLLPQDKHAPRQREVEKDW